MKKRMAIMLASIIAVSGCYSPGSVSMAAGQAEDISAGIEGLSGDSLEIDDNELLETGGGELPDAEPETDGSESTGNDSEADINGNDEDDVLDTQAIDPAGSGKAGIVTLQLPQKLEIILDPWNMDGNGQIYSEQYVIRNTGEESGVLVLSNLICLLEEQEGIIVRTDNEGIHDGQAKCIYMEMAFGNDDSVIMTQEGSEYEVRLAPGEELPFRFLGEVNENADSLWADGDFEVKVTYSWDIEGMVAEADEAELVDEAEESANADEGSETGQSADADEGKKTEPSAGADEDSETEPPADADEDKKAGSTDSADDNEETEPAAGEDEETGSAAGDGENKAIEPSAGVDGGARKGAVPAGTENRQVINGQEISDQAVETSAN